MSPSVLYSGGVLPARHRPQPGSREKRPVEAGRASAAGKRRSGRASTEFGRSRACPPSESASRFDMTVIEPFVFPGLRSRVIFGPGSIAQTAAEIEKLGRTRALSSLDAGTRRRGPRRLRRAGRRALCRAFSPGCAAMHTPIEVMDDGPRDLSGVPGRLRGLRCGGGSTTGLGKAIADRPSTRSCGSGRHPGPLYARRSEMTEDSRRNGSRREDDAPRPKADPCRRRSFTTST